LETILDLLKGSKPTMSRGQFCQRNFGPNTVRRIKKCSIKIYLQEDVFVQVQLVTTDVAWIFMEFCKMRTSAIIHDTWEVSPANPANY
jgi:hypothetical protein